MWKLSTSTSSEASMDYETILYAVDGSIATITLNRPEQLNAIAGPVPHEIEKAMHAATIDERVKVVVLRGAGRAFCAGADFGGNFDYVAKWITTDGKWDPGKDLTFFGTQPTSPTQKVMSIWRSPKPVIAQVHGWCLGAGSDYALCADLVVASEDAQIGTPYSRLWGAYLSGMWIYRLGLARAKYHALTGRPLNGRQAADIQLINEAVPFEQLEARVRELAEDLASIPAAQLAAQKMIVNQAYENMGLASTQQLGGILDGLMRNIPAAHEFITTAAEHGVPAAVAARDARFGDYSQAPADGKPNPAHVIHT
jgi:enoyl-CoA hydratase